MHSVAQQKHIDICFENFLQSCEESHKPLLACDAHKIKQLFGLVSMLLPYRRRTQYGSALHKNSARLGQPELCRPGQLGRPDRRKRSKLLVNLLGCTRTAVALVPRRRGA